MTLDHHTIGIALLLTMIAGLSTGIGSLIALVEKRKKIEKTKTD